ncbi:MAG: hypothetical protein SOZ59_12365 [Candidatus Limivivens sp.]|nr:hypothetical protein [Candidatus Limivivens sp.]
MKKTKKGNTFLIFFGMFFTVCMVGLAAYVTVFLNTSQTEQPPVSSGTMISAAPEEASPSPALSTETVRTETALPAHSFVFLGDSRTVGMRNALAELGIEDDCTFLAKDGEGYYWLQNTALSELIAILDQRPDTVVITNLGVNDLTERSSYAALYRSLMERYPDTSFYILSVNPVSEDCSMVSNTQIEEFNEGMAAEFPDLYLDCYHYLMTDGYETVDGLHYTWKTYAKIHDYAVKEAAER